MLNLFSEVSLLLLFNFCYELLSVVALNHHNPEVNISQRVYYGVHGGVWYCGGGIESISKIG